MSHFPFPSPDGLRNFKVRSEIVTLVMTHSLLLKMAHVVRGFTMIYLLKMNIFHSSVSLQEGTHDSVPIIPVTSRCEATINNQ